MSSNSNDTSAIIKETAIYSYVSGELSGSAKMNFEKQLSTDPELQQEVEREKAVTANFADLLNKIEQQEAHSSDVEDVSHNTTQVKQSARVIAFPNWGVRQLGIAACLAMVGVVSVGFFTDLTDPNFQTLSNKEASAKIDFSALADQGRLAKIALSEQLDDVQIDQLLEQYELQTFKSGADKHNIYVFSEKMISAADIKVLASDKRVKRVETFTANSEK